MGALDLVMDGQDLILLSLVKISLIKLYKLLCNVCNYVTFTYKVQTEQTNRHWNRLGTFYTMEKEWSGLEAV